MTAFRYEWGKAENKAKSKELGRPFYEPAVFCRFVKKDGDIVLPVNDAFKQTHLTVRFPNDAEHVRQVEVLSRALDDFQKNGTKEIAGTPIKEWPLVNAAEVENLRLIGIESVEQLADVPDVDLKLKGISKGLRTKAQEYMKHAADGGAATEKVTALREENAFLKEENDTLKKQVADLGKEIDALKKAAAEAKTSGQTNGK